MTTTASLSSAWLGCGWSYPVAPSERNHTLALVAGADKVRQAIWLILDTEPGERIMRPDFGCGLRRHLMAPNTVATRTVIQRDVLSALAQWEPRIQVQSVSVEPAAQDPAVVLISVDYRHTADGRPDNLVFPFALS